MEKSPRPSSFWPVKQKGQWSVETTWRSFVRSPCHSLAWCSRGLSGVLLEVVEVHSEADLYGFQAAVEGGPRDVVELGGPGLVAAGGEVGAQHGQQVLLGLAQQPVQLPLGEGLHVRVVAQQADQAAQVDVPQADDRREVEGGGGVGDGVRHVPGLAQTGGDVVPGDPGVGRGDDRAGPAGLGAQPGREVRGEGARVLVAGEAEQHGGGSVGQFGDQPGQAQQAQ
ncbi:hypothetical protein SVIOM74S_04985 [Streptomyces violarus]